MPGVYLDAVHMKRESKSFTDSLHAVLTAANLFNGPKYMLSGLTGMAFKFTVHERLLRMSVSAYGQWGIEHQPAVDNLGIYTEWAADRTRHPTFRSYQADAIRWIKSSLDREISVIYWIPEFGVIHGYDDDDQVFYIQDGWSGESQVMLYDNLGLNFTGFWYCQTFGDKLPIPQRNMVLESLRMATDDWEPPHKTLPDKAIASGRLAYRFLIQGLQNGDYDEGGAVYILDSYLYSRIEIMKYLSEVQRTWPELHEASIIYQQLVGTISDIEDCITDRNGMRRVNRECIPELVEMLGAALSLEERAIGQFRLVSGPYPDPKRTTIARWGTSSPR